MSKNKFPRTRRSVALLAVAMIGALAARAASPDPSSDESEVAVQPRPRILLWIDGSPEENTIWRGWPAIVRTQTLSGEAPTTVELNGPSPVPLTRAGAVWLVFPAASANLPVGNYILSTGAQKIAVTVADAPKTLTPEQRSMQSALLVQSALSAGNPADAKQAAEAWIAAAPNRFEAREALGDALLATGDSAGALDAFNAAVQRVPRGIDPPPAGLLEKIATLLRERAANSTANSATPPPSPK